MKRKRTILSHIWKLACDYLEQGTSTCMSGEDEIDEDTIPYYSVSYMFSELGASITPSPALKSVTVSSSPVPQANLARPPFSVLKSSASPSNITSFPPESSAILGTRSLSS
jgi:hypothetical protein